MTSYVIIEQLIADRRADLTRSWPLRVGTTRRRRGLTLRRGAGNAPRRAHGAEPSPPAVPLDQIGPAGAEGVGPSAASIARLVAARGLSQNEPAIAHVLRVARRHHVLPIHAEIVADRSLPDVVRERALGHLLTWLARPSDAHRDAVDDAA